MIVFSTEANNDIVSDDGTQSFNLNELNLEFEKHGGIACP